MSDYDLRKRSYIFSVRLVKLLSRTASSAVSSSLVKQLVRSGTSIGANIEEGDSSPSRKDFRNKMFIAKKEAAETLYWIKMLLDAEIINNQNNINEAKELLNEAEQLLRIIGSMTRKIK